MELYRVQLDSIDGFDVAFVAVVDEDLDYSFQDGLQALIDNGKYIGFMAVVEVSKAGIVLGNDFLGGCIYDSFEAFHTTHKDGYLKDMIVTALSDSKDTLCKINAS